MVKRKYRALRAIAFILQVLAWISLVLAILGAIGAVGAGFLNIVSIPALDQLRGSNATIVAGIIAGAVAGVIILIGGIINFILLLAASEYIYVQIDIEQNTRQGTEYLRQLVTTQQMVDTRPVAETAATAATVPMPAIHADPYAPAPTVTAATNPEQK